MSEHVEIAKDGIFVHRWKSKTGTYVRKRAKKIEILKYLRDRCEIAPGVTLGEIFKAVDRYKLLKLFISQYSWCGSLEQFHAQAEEPMRVDEDVVKLDYLEIYHHPDVNSSSEKIKHKNGMREKITVVDFESYPSFHGIGDPETDDMIDPNDAVDMLTQGKKKINYSVSYSPMWELADVPVVLKKEFDVYEKFDSTRHNRNNRPQKLMTATREYTFLEVLDAIYWDISFMGGPDDNKEFLEGMKERLDEVKSGLVPLIPLGKVIPGQDETTSDGKPKVLLHPDVARALGVNPNSIPLDDKEFIRTEEPS